jgi:hypothetical protein
MMDKTASELKAQFKDWMSNPAISKNLGSHASVVRNETAELLGQHDLLMKNSKTKPTIAVFGPSQAGKSYLTAKICEGIDESVSVKIDKDYDFLRQLNPAGGRESTALVTRMTTHRDVAKRKDQSRVHGSLLSLFDLIAIFANIYASDLKQKNEISRDMISTKIESVCGSDILSQIHSSENWIDPGIIYLKRVLSYLPFDLRPFTDLLKLPAGSLEKMSAGQLTELFSSMWGEVDELSSLFEHLCEYLVELNFSSSIQIPVEAFVPREISIIDVAILSDLQKLDSYNEQLVQINPSCGGSLKIPRPVLCALISEVEFVLNQPKTPLLNSVDILDFPGARSRIRRDIQQYEESGVDKLFLRGKISHLFESASLRDEIDTLLLCVKPGPMDIATLPETITRWIDGVAESQITRRLFILTTQFDLHFPDAAGQSKGDKERFDNAIFSAVLEPFAPTEDSWIYALNFKNTFPIRNPNYPYNGFFLYEKSGREVALRDDALERIEELEKAFSESKNIKGYMHQISEKWASLMSPGDGGAYFLINDLASGDWEEIKNTRLILKQKELFLKIMSLLEPFAVHDDISKKLGQERQKFLQHFLKLQRLAEKRSLASFSEVFTVRPLDLQASVSADILSDDDTEENSLQLGGVRIPSFLQDELSEDNQAKLQSPQEKFFEKVISALLVALVEELANNLKNNNKSLPEYSDTIAYLASHFTSEHQLEKLGEKLMVLSAGWTTGLKLTDKLEPLCMVASLVFDEHFFPTAPVDKLTDVSVTANPIVSSFRFERALSGNVSFFNDWMDHIGQLIEANVANASGGGYDMALNSELLSLLEKTKSYVDQLGK